MTIEQEIEKIIYDFRHLGELMNAQVKKAVTEAGNYFAVATEVSAPVGAKAHKRYSTTKVNRSVRAPKGMGKVVATYMPGNLARSIRVLDLKKTKNAVYVGAKLKGPKTGTFQGQKADGYYMHMVERGTKNWKRGHPFFLASWVRSEPTVTKIIIANLTMAINKFKAETGL